MVFKPTPQDDIEESIESRLRGRLANLTNFVGNSFNKVFLGAFADELYEYEVRLLAAQLSGWVEYAGGPITEDDIERLGITGFDDLEMLNEFMQDEHLDNIGQLVGVTRSLGEAASGQVVIETFDNTTRVPDGMDVATAPGVDGSQLVYSVDLGDETEFVTPEDQNNIDTVTVDVVASETGNEYNVGANTITRLRSPPPGVEGVTNPLAIDGGENVETNDELRERIKNAVFETSGGGTTEGIRGYLIGNVDDVTDVFLDEFLDSDPVFVDVVVDGGVESEVRDAIEQSRPAGVRHNLVRPTVYTMAIDVEVQGSDVDTLEIRDSIEQYLFSLDLGDSYINDRIVQIVMNTDTDVENVLAINSRIVSVTNQRVLYESGKTAYDLSETPFGYIEDERHYFDGTADLYELAVEPVDPDSVSVEAIVDGSPDTILTQGTDYTVIDSEGNGMFDAIDFSVGGVSPDLDTVFEVNYDTVTETSETITFDGSDEFALTTVPALAADSSVSDASGDTYERGTDYDIVDANGDGELETIRWLDGGSTPDTNEEFTVTYEVDAGSIRSVSGELNGDEDHTFVEGTDFNELDSTGDGRTDQIDWSIGGDTPDPGTTFMINTSVQANIVEDYDVIDREKISPATDEITVTVYD